MPAFLSLIRRTTVSLCLFGCLLFVPCSSADQNNAPAFQLNDRNRECPFCYVAGGSTSWPIATGKRSKDDLFILSVRVDGEITSTGESVTFEGLTISTDDDGRLQVDSSEPTDNASLQIDIRHDSAGGISTTQELQIRRAPPARPLTYLADFGDEIIRIFGGANNQYRPITKAGFDQYFRRLQAQGISRLIMWQSPFPYIVDRKNYSTEDWQRYEGQARAILDSKSLTAGIQARSAYAAYGWLRQLMALRLMPELGEMISTSANDHNIKLTASFRPFEAALTKYYVIPAFEADGHFLWNFQPLSSPTVNYHPDQIGFAHYREILRQMGRPESSDMSTITLPGIDNAADLVERSQQGYTDLTVRAVPFPPLASESFVLVRQPDRSFELLRWSDIQLVALSHVPPMEQLRLELRNNELVIPIASVPDNCPYLWITQPDDSAVEYTVSTTTPAVMHAAAGNRLGGENIFFAWDEKAGEKETTRVNGIPADGQYHAEFQATEASIARCFAGTERVSLSDKQMVISLGDRYSIEMMDFNQPAAREFAVKQLQTLLKLPAFDDIFINTRSHTQMAGYLGDDGTSIQPIPAKQRAGIRNVQRIGLDKAYAPRAAAKDELIQQLASDATTIEHITTVQAGAWGAVTCQSPTPYAWRYTRNQLVAKGVRSLLLDLRQEFPTTRIRAVIPPSAEAVDRILTRLDELPASNGIPFGREYYRRLWCSNNHIPTIGEGLAMVDLSGTNIEPVLLGTGGYSQEQATLDLYVQECIADLATNRGSSFRGPRSYFFEAQFSLRAKDKTASRHNREAVISYLLSQKKDIGEVILYEAADWTYFLPLTDPDLCGHGFIDRLEQISFD